MFSDFSREQIDPFGTSLRSMVCLWHFSPAIVCWRQVSICVVLKLKWCRFAKRPRHHFNSRQRKRTPAASARLWGRGSQKGLIGNISENLWIYRVFFVFVCHYSGRTASLQPADSNYFSFHSDCVLSISVLRNSLLPDLVEKPALAFFGEEIYFSLRMRTFWGNRKIDPLHITTSVHGYKFGENVQNIWSVSSIYPPKYAIQPLRNFGQGWQMIGDQNGSREKHPLERWAGVF